MNESFFLYWNTIWLVNNLQLLVLKPLHHDKVTAIRKGNRASHNSYRWCLVYDPGDGLELAFRAAGQRRLMLSAQHISRDQNKTLPPELWRVRVPISYFFYKELPLLIFLERNYQSLLMWYRLKHEWVKNNK